MSELDNVYNAAVKLYNKMADMIEEIYNKSKKKMNIIYSKKKLMEGFDLYFQSLLSHVAFSDGDIDKIELLFIKNISRYHNYLKKYNDQDDYEINAYSSLCLKEVPDFVKLVVAYDKTEHEAGNLTDNSEVLLELLLKLTILLASIDEKVTQEEMTDSTKILKPVIDYIKNNK